ncbi:serine hydrolase domain-containing protein [[Clostridium] polysaccharolyticum]|uniref:CubicO group peptidase, beta-lactamase class C family n=1 Tax=[Clostridium] polysaccharolyticum TaxID=29364 RepID=A0A1H9YN37_9FIRM|nr:serine hydrolase [[Clostridium] polysaccharolyticum]SES70545.1 CubicO group peptidase, beta-lactamase class C family [[Clostridium] polysaccharolyticum]
MGIKLRVRTLDFFSKIVNGNINKVSYIEFEPQKPSYVKRKAKKKLPRSTPEEQGISSKYLKEFLMELDREEAVHTQGIMIARNGAVVLEGAYAPYELDTWRITHSLCKSFVGIAVGIAIEEGYFALTDTVASIFGKEYHFIKGLLQKDITIQNLLTMSSGIAFNEVGAVIDREWRRSFLDAMPSFKPGSEFAYNSMNTYMLSAIIQKTTNVTLMDYLREHIFEPLGIENIYWEESPEFIVKGGWGCYISLEDRTKIGQLLLNKGKWEGKQLIPEKWIFEMTKKQIDTPHFINQYGYGYQIWIGKRRGSFIMNGVLGQNTIVLPDINMVISILSSNENLFLESKLMDIIEKYFAGDDFCPEQPMEPNHMMYSQLRNYIGGLSFEKPFERVRNMAERKNGWPKAVSKKRSRFSSLVSDFPYGLEQITDIKFYVNEETSASIIPLFIQTMQNNFSQGIKSFQFRKEKGLLILDIEEKELRFQIPIGFARPQYSVLDIHGELYRISAWGILTYTEDEKPVLKLQIAFLENTNCRTMKFYFERESVCVKVNETPDLSKVIDGLIPFLGISLPLGGVETIKNTELVQSRISQIVSPEFYAFTQKHGNK